MSAKHAMKTFAVVDLNKFIASSFTTTMALCASQLPS
jgi:hypothetical protein